MSPGSRSASAMSRMTRARPSMVPAETGKPTSAPVGRPSVRSAPPRARQGAQALQQLLFLRPRLLPPLLEALLAGARREVLDVAEDHGHERGGAFAPTRPRDVDLADAAHAVHVEEGPDSVPRFPPARKFWQLVQETLVVDVSQKSHHLRMRADHVRDVQERQSHLRRDVLTDGLRERG